MNPYKYVAELPEISSPVVGIDTETTGLDPHSDEFTVLQLAVPGQTYLIKPEDAHILEPLLVDEYIIKVMHNAAFDMKFFRQHLGVWALNIWDTMNIEKVLTSGTNLRVGLNHVALRRFGMDLDKGIRETFIGFAGGDLTEEQQEYAALDAEVLLYIYKQQVEEVQNNKNHDLEAMEDELAAPLAQMELAGMGFNLDLWFQYLDELWYGDSGLIATRNKVIELLAPPRWKIDIFGNRAGLNLNSVPQRKEALDQLFKRSSHPGPKTLPDTNKKTIKRFRAIYYDDKQIVKTLDAYLRYTKLSTMVGWGYENYVNPATGRIHTSYMQNGAKTGRLSSRKPNLQNISRPEENMPNLRKLFYSVGGMLITADYSQQEMRILAQLSQDPALIEACEEGDFHLNMARMVFNDPTIEKDDERRQLGKRLSFALAYGVGPATFAEYAEIPYDEAEEILYTMRTKFSVAEEWAQHQLHLAVTQGYVETIIGRRIHFPNDIKFDKGAYASSARNYPVQGSAGDTLKEVKRRLWRDYLFDKDTQETVHGVMVQTVHDEITIDNDPNIVDRPSSAKKINEIVLRVFAEVGADMVPDVPIIADSVIGKEWSK